MPARDSDVVSIDAIINAAYDGISGPAGQKRDWERERALFWPGARLIPTAQDAGNLDVDLAPRMLTVDDFIARAEALFEKTGFYEKEIGRKIEHFGRIAHVWSTYESRHDPRDPEPFMRGINPENIRGGSLASIGSTKARSIRFPPIICSHPAPPTTGTPSTQR